MKFQLVNQVWQLALVYEIRRQTLLNGRKPPIKLEFDEEYGEIYYYALITKSESAEEGIATLRINYVDERTAKLERVSVIPKFQRQGVGNYLLQQTENILRDRNYKEILVHSFEPALHFYLKNGYQIDESVTIDSEIPQIALRKIL